MAALVTLVAPAGLGIRDAAFAWAVKGAVPGDSFAVGSLIAIVVRGVLTVVEVIYVGIVTALGRREGWSIHTGVLHPSPEEEEAAGSRRVGGAAPCPRTSRACALAQSRLRAQREASPPSIRRYSGMRAPSW